MEHSKFSVNRLNLGRSKFMIFTLVFLCLVVVFSYNMNSVSAAGNTVYVNSTGGSDAWDGSSLAHTNATNGPKATIGNGVGMVTKNGTLYIADGKYSGAANNNITITTDMNINGQSQNGAIINGSNTNWIFTINSGISVTISYLTLANGNSSIGTIFNKGLLNITNCTLSNNNGTDGGAISNLGILNVSGSTFIGNTASEYGAAISSQKTLTVTNSTFTNNAANWSGGAIINNCGTLNVIGSYFNGNIANAGGAIANAGITGDPGVLYVTGSNFINNTANGKGGAIINNNWGIISIIPIATISDSSFYNNTAQLGGAIYNVNNGTCNVTNSLFNNNTGIMGGAISSDGVMNITGSTFNVNNATNGAAICNTGIIEVNSNDFTANIAASNGGVIYNSGGTANVHFNRILGNTGYLGNIIYNSGGTLDASLNWWGDNYGPTTKINNEVTVLNWLVLRITPTPNIISNNGYSTITADITHDNNGALQTTGHVPDGILVHFIINVKSSYSPLINGMAQSTLNGAGLTNGNRFVSATVDDQNVQTPVMIDTIPPKVSLLDPTNNSGNIATNKVIKVTFNEAIKAGNMVIELKNSKGTLIPITTSISGNILKINHKALLTSGKYSLTLHTGCVTDLAGNNLAISGSSFTVDSIAPKVKTVTPARTAIKVSTKQIIKITFSEPIKAGNMVIELKTSGGKEVKLIKTISGNTLTLKPATYLSKRVKYTIILHTGSVTDLAGNNLALYSSSFTTI